MLSIKLFRSYNSKRTCALYLYSSNKYRFCHKNRQKKKKKYPQVYLEECKYKIKKKKIVKFIDAELDLDDSDDSNCE